MGTALRARQVTPVTAVAFGVFTLGVGISRVPLDSLIHQTELGGSAAEWLTSAAALGDYQLGNWLVALCRPQYLQLRGHFLVHECLPQTISDHAVGHVWSGVILRMQGYGHLAAGCGLPGAWPLDRILRNFHQAVRFEY